MKNSLLAEEISFYGAAEGAYFYGDDAAGTSGANAGAASAAGAASVQNPYAVLALFDASFATFGADYAEALAAINAAIAELNDTLQTLEKLVNADGAEAEEVKQAAAAAADRASAQVEFAANVADREQDVLKAQKAIAEELKIDTTAPVETVAAKIAEKVAEQAGVQASDIANAANNIEHSAAIAAVVAKKVAISDAVKKTVEKQAKAEQKAAVEDKIVIAKAKSQLAKKATEAKMAVKKAEKAGKSADEIAQLKEDAKNAADVAKKAAAGAETAELAAAKKAAADAAQKIATAAQTANTAKEAKKNLTDDELQKEAQKAATAASEAQAAKDKAAENEKAAAQKYAVEFVVGAGKEAEKFKAIFASVGDYLTFKNALETEKTDAAAKTAIAGLALSELAGKNIDAIIDESGDQWTISVPDAAKPDAVAKFNGGLSVSMAKGKSVAEFLAATKKFDGATAAELTTDFTALNGHKIAQADDENMLKITLAEDVEIIVSAEDKDNYKFSDDEIEALVALTAASTKFDELNVEQIGAAKVGATLNDKLAVLTMGSASYAFKYGEIALEKIAQIAGKSGADAVKAAAEEAGMTAIGKLTNLASSLGDGDKLNTIDNFSEKLANAGDIAELHANGGKLLGYVMKTAAGYDWALAANSVLIKNVSADAKQADIAALDARDKITVESVKKVLASGAESATILRSGEKTLEITLGEADKSTATVAGAKLTLAESAKLVNVAELASNANLADVHGAGVLKVGDLEVTGADALAIGEGAGKIALTMAANNYLSAFKDLTAKSTIDELVAAGVAQVGAHKIGKSGDKFTVNIGGVDYVIIDASAATASALAGAAEDSTFVQSTSKNVAGHENDAVSSLFVHAPNEDDFVVVKVADDVKGKLAKTDGGYSWTSADGAVAIEKINGEAKISALVQVASGAEEISSLKAISSPGGSVLVGAGADAIELVLGANGEQNSAKIAGAKLIFADNATANGIADIAATGAESTMTALVAAKVSKIGDAALTNDTTLTIAGTALTLANSTKLAAIKDLSAASSVKALVDAGITQAGEHALSAANGAYFITIGAAQYKLKNADATALSALANITASDENLQASSQSVSDDSALISTLTAALSEGDELAVKDARGAEKGTLKMTASGATWTAGDVQVSNINTGAQISKLFEVTSDAAEILAVTAISSPGGTVIKGSGETAVTITLGSGANASTVKVAGATLTLNDNVSIATVATLTGEKTVANLITAGVNAVDGNAIKLENVSDYFITIGADKYKFTNNSTDLSAIHGFSEDKSALVIVQKDVSAPGTMKISEITGQLGSNGSVKLVSGGNEKGTLATLDGSDFSWTSNAGDVKIDKLDANKNVSDLIEVVDDNVDFTAIKKVANVAAGAKVKVGSDLTAKEFTLSADANATTTASIETTTLTLNDGAIISDVAALSGGKTIQQLITAGVNKAGAAELKGDTKITINSVVLELKDANKTLDDIKALTATSSAKDLIDAGVTKVGEKEVCLDGSDYLVKIGSDKFKFDDAKSTQLGDFSTLNSGSDNLTQVTFNVTNPSDNISTITSSKLTTNGDKLILVDGGVEKGTLATDNGSDFSWKSNAGDVKIAKIKTDVAISLLTAIASDGVSLADIKAVADATTTVKVGPLAQEKTFTLASGNDNTTATIAGAQLTLGDSATLSTITALTGSEDIASLRAKHVKKVANVTLTSDTQLEIDTVTPALTVDAGATLNGIKGLQASSTMQQLHDAQVSNIGDIELKSATSLEITGTPALTFANANAQLSVIAGLKTSSSVANLITAGVTQVGEYKISEAASSYFVEIGGDKYKFTDSGSTQLSGFANAISNKTNLTIAEKNLAASPAGTISDITGLLANQDDEVVVNVDGNKVGTIKKVSGGFSWTSAQGDIAISKLATGQNLSDLVAIASADAKISTAQALADGAADITVSAATVPADLFSAQYKEGATFANYTAYNGEKSIANLKELIAVGQSGVTIVADVKLKNANAGDDGEWQLAVGSSSPVNISKLKAGALVTDIQNVNAKSVAPNTLQNLFDNDTDFTVGGKTFKFDSSALMMKIGESYIEVDTTKITQLSDLATLEDGGLADDSGLAFAFEAAGATLDLSNFKGTGEVTIKAHQTPASVSAAETATYSLNYGDSATTFSVTTPELSGDGADAHMITFDLTGFGAGDKLVLTFVETLVANTTTVSGLQSTDMQDITVTHSSNNMSEVTYAEDINATSIVKIAAALDGNSDAGAANALYYAMDADGSTLYLMNMNAVHDNGSGGDTDATIIKITGLNSNTINWLKSQDITTAATLTIEGQA